MRATAAAALLVSASLGLSAQQPPRPAPGPATIPSPTVPTASRGGADVVTPAQLAAAIDKLGTLDFAERMAAARTARRAEAALAVPTLLKAVESHPDAYVRFRALVLLSGFNDPRTRDVMRGALGLQNDRLRAVAYTYFERNPDPTVVPQAARRLADRIVGVRPPGADPRARRVRQRSRRSPDHGRAGDEGAGVLPQRRHRGARRLQGRLCRRPDHRGREDRRAAAGRCGASRSARSETRPRSRR